MIKEILALLSIAEDKGERPFIKLAKGKNELPKSYVKLFNKLKK
jgi:hypothetical protein